MVKVSKRCTVASSGWGVLVGRPFKEYFQTNKNIRVVLVRISLYVYKKARTVGIAQIYISNGKYVVYCSLCFEANMVPGKKRRKKKKKKKGGAMASSLICLNEHGAWRVFERTFRNPICLLDEWRTQPP